MDWELIRQQKETKLNKESIRKNRNQVDHNYKVGDKVMLANNIAYKYETQYKGLFWITRCFTNGTVILQCGATQIMHNICRIKPYKYDTKVEDIISKTMYDYVNI